METRQGAASVTTEHDSVRDYYGRVLSATRDLKTGACCVPDAIPEGHREILGKIHPDVLERFYGCGSPLPPLLEGVTVLDLGCGTGRDAFLAAALAGPRGRVIGVDMTEEQIAVARRHEREQAARFGFAAPNTRFVQGYIENLAELDIADDSVDVVISNCVINLSPHKERVFSEIFRVLKPGGELHFADVFAGSRVPSSLREDPVLLGECLAGALYVEDFRRLLRDLGCLDYRLLSRRRIAIDDPAIDARIGGIDFFSITVRAFKLNTLEDICEDYGQIATYRGTIPGAPHRFVLDDHHEFTAGKPMPVCGNTASMVSETRYGAHFTVAGGRERHFGPFACAPAEGGSGRTDAPCC